MPAAKTLRTKITQAVVTSCLRNRDVRQVLKDTELRGLRIAVGDAAGEFRGVEPFRRDAMKTPVAVAGISKSDMQSQIGL